MIAQLYPQASTQLAAARDHKSEMATAWNKALDLGLLSESVVTDSDGSGRISGHINWPPSLQRDLTEGFRDCVDALWATLDCLVKETVSAFSVQRRIRNPQSPRFFPVADSLSTFEALLEQSSLDGVLQPHYQIVRDSQPFVEDSGNERADRMRAAIRQLIEWENGLDMGSTIEPWATPATPDVMVEPPAVLEYVEPQSAGPLRVERVLALFQLRKYRHGDAVFGRSGTYVDLCFPTGFEPSGIDDTFESRLSTVIEAVELFAAYFAHFTHQVKGAKRVLSTSQDDSALTWVTAAESPRRWSSAELADLTKSDTGLARVLDADEFTLIVSTPSGVYERVIPRATPLRQLERRGLAAEAAIQDAAATWGLPDFVMVPIVERKGAGVREISDGLLVVGNQGIIVQAKAREGAVGGEERERSWINKQIAAGVRQVEGTERRLGSAKTRMANGRGHNVSIDGPAISWAGVVVIEHPDPPKEFEITEVRSRIPIVVLLRRDWEFLFNQLRSTHAVVSYLHRVGEPTEILGAEPERYYEFAAADAAASPGSLDPSIDGLGEVSSVPLLPTAPAGSDDDEAHGMVRIMLEDLATTDFEPHKLDALQSVLAALDTLPVGHRSDLGRLLLDGLASMRDMKPQSTAWRFRTYLAGPDDVQLGFAVCSRFDETVKVAFRSWLMLRHHERGERIGSFEGLISIGIMLTPRQDGMREWDTTMFAIEGDLEHSPEDLAQFRELWNH